MSAQEKNTELSVHLNQYRFGEGRVGILAGAGDGQYLVALDVTEPGVMRDEAEDAVDVELSPLASLLIFPKLEDLDRFIDILASYRDDWAEANGKA